jgi:hypothetical protein
MILASILFLSQRTPSTFQLVGRFLAADGGYACEWPGSAVRFVSRSKSVKAKFVASTPNDRWQVDVDGKPTEVLKLDPKVEDYTISLPDTQKHIVTLVRRTECFSGKTVFKGVEGSSGVPVPLKRRIEIIGDSISAGFGVDGKTKEEAYSFDTANAYMTYGWIAARKYQADCTIVAWSGRKMWPDNTIPEIFDLVLPAANLGKSEAPDNPDTQAVLINLATNDFGKGIPDREKWCGAYVTFAQKVRKRFPSAHLYLATGSMMSDGWPPNERHLSTLKGYLDSIKATLKDSKVHRIDFAVQNEAKDGIGSSWHPNAKTQTKMAQVFSDALHRDLGW